MALIDDLMAESACFCGSGGSTAERTIMALLQRIVEAGSGGGGVATTPGLPLNSVQFNNAGSFGGSADLTFNDATNTLALNGLLVFGTAAVISNVGGGDGLRFTTGFTTRWDISPTGHFLSSGATDNVLDIGAIGANRPRIGYFGTRVDAPTLRTDQAFTVATLPAFGVAGRRAYVTNALAPAYGAVVAGGGAVVTSVMDNGAAWIVS